MSSVLQLQISGVRSFDNHDTQHLKFASPLTLICGQNGVGKTTVIECLRYVTTGDLPPNVKGGAFVHDPRMASVSEVFAQVKLLFNSVTGVKMVATRSMRLNVTSGNKLTFKTLEGNVKEQADTSAAVNKTASVSARYSDMNLQVPLLLGVPPAILNYVVFCHQEDSAWPFAEPSVVKKRFDDIFEATKYTKALDSLKVVRKDYMSNIRVETKDVEHLEQDKQRVVERENQLDDIQSRLTALGSDTADLQKQRIAKSEELNSAVEHKQSVQRLEYAISDFDKQIKRAEQDISTITDDIREVLEATTEDIEKELLNSDAKQLELRDEMDSETRRLQDVNNKLEYAHQTLASLDNHQGRLEQQLDAHNSRRQQRWKLVHGNEVEFVEENEVNAIEEWSKRQRKIVNELTAEIEALELKNRQVELQLTQKISFAEAKHLQLMQVIGSLKKAVGEDESEEHDLLRQIDELQSDSLDFKQQREVMEKRLESLTSESEAAQREFEEYEKENNLNRSLEAVKLAEVEADTSRKILTEAISASKRMSQLQHFRERYSELQGLTGTCAQEMFDLIGNRDTKFAEELVNETRISYTNAETNIKLLESRNGTLLGEIEALEKRKNSTGDEISSLTHQHNITEEMVLTYDSDLRIAENALLESTEEQEQLSFAHKYFERALNRASNSHSPSCLLCEHKKSPEEAEMFVKLLKEKIASFDITPEQAAEETNVKRETLEALRNMGTYIEQYNRRKDDIKNYENELQRLKSTNSETEDHLKKAKVDINDLQSKIEYHSRVLMPVISKSKRYEVELGEVESKIQLEEKMLGVTSSQYSLSEAQNQQEMSEKGLKAARLSLEEVRMEHDKRKSQTMKLAQGVHELRLAISELELKSAKVQKLHEILAKTRSSRRLNEEKQKDAESQLPSAEAETNVSKSELSKCKLENSKAEKELAEKRILLSQKIRKYDEISTEIEQFVKQYGNDPMSKLKEERRAAEQNLSKLKTEIASVQSVIKNLEAQMVDSTSFRRNLQDNLRLRKYNEELDSLKSKQNEAKAELLEEQQKFGVTFSDYEARICSLQDQIGSINHKISTIAGESKALQEQIQVIRHELSTTYRDTAEQYEKALAQLNSSKGAAHELAQYSAALDRSIMKYHHLKMDEINDSLDQMWKQTYTGTDIDTIMICSEPGEGINSTSSVSRTSHNYRVCMVKQDTVLDMRGRCSAGQKVLASILIRMALAECFGNSSGLIVLDEPTTNLDHENIEALAHSLSGIISMRRSQPNFQLIVITHDEHFLTQMNPSSHCSYYYKISRDDRQLSVINKMPISSLT